MNKNPKDIIIELDQKFRMNFECWTALSDSKLDKVFVGLRCIGAIGELLEPHKSAKHHDICCKLYDEIFSDGVSAIYLASIAMDKPANIVLRRIIELGVAAVYLWDMPHVAYSWNSNECDLSFSEMLKHVNSEGYRTFISNENSTSIDTEIFDSSSCQKIYGSLSDIVHGKITTFESSLPDRFVFSNDDWHSFIDLLEDVLDILIKAYLMRYLISNDLFSRIPQAKSEYK
jgi:hypothetical protein